MFAYRRAADDQFCLSYWRDRDESSWVREQGDVVRTGGSIENMSRDASPERDLHVMPNSSLYFTLNLSDTNPS